MFDHAQEAYDRVAGQYDTTFGRPLDLAENQIVFDALARFDGLNVLDVGCGTGLYLEHRKPGFYLGLDISNGMLDKARAKFPHKLFIQGDMAHMGSLPRAPFDVIMSTFGCMSYCLEPWCLAEEVYRLLKPGGHFYFMALGNRYRSRKTHITNGDTPYMTYTAKALEDNFKKFACVQVRGLNLFGDSLAGLLGQRIGRYLAWEYRTLARWTPDLCYNLIVTGQKPCLG